MSKRKKKAYAEETRTVALKAPAAPPSRPATGPMQPPYLPFELHDVEIVFSVNGYDRLPEMRVCANVDARWVRFVEMWFNNGAGKASESIVAKEGIDMKKAVRHLQSVMGTWDTKHEHKLAGVAFLMQTWFTWKDDA